MQPIDKSLALLGAAKNATLTEIKASYRKKILAYSSSATGAAKLEEISAAYVEVIEDHQQKALQQGSEDPQSAEILQKCEEFLPGQAKVKSSLLIIKLKHSGNVWKKVIKQKYPGAVSTGPRIKAERKGRKDAKKSETPLGNKFSTTWRPVGDYIHLKVLFHVQDNTLQVSGTSYILWAAENYQECCKIADEIAAKEAEEEEEPDDGLDDSQKMDEIIRCIRGMKGEIDHITSKIETLEMNQETAHNENMSTHTRLDEMAVKVKEIRQLTGVSAKIQEERDVRHAKKTSTIVNEVSPEAGRSSSPVKSPVKKKRPPPGSPKKKAGARKKINSEEKNKFDDPDSGYKSPPKYEKDEIVKQMEEDDDEKIEEMIDDISTNEMFGSSILSMEN